MRLLWIGRGYAQRWGRGRWINMMDQGGKLSHGRSYHWFIWWSHDRTYDGLPTPRYSLTKGVVHDREPYNCGQSLDQQISTLVKHQSCLFVFLTYRFPYIFRSLPLTKPFNQQIFKIIVKISQQPSSSKGEYFFKSPLKMRWLRSHS